MFSLRCDPMETHTAHVPHDPAILATPSLPATAPPSRERIASLDLLRLLAAIGIVWFHTDEAARRSLGYAGLPIFLLIFYCLVVKWGHVHTSRHFLKRRWNRLLQPWLFWSVAYGLCRLIKSVYLTDHQSLHSLFSVETILAGTSYHLWYLPYAFLSGFLVYLIQRWTRHANHTTVVLSAAAIGAVMLIAYAMGWSLHRGIRPLAQWQFGLLAVPLGFAIGRCLMISSRPVRTALLSTISLTVMAVYAVLDVYGSASPVLPYVLAVVLVCLACVRPGRNNAFTASLASLTFGVYLLHPMVAYGLRPFLAADPHYVMFIALTAGISGLVTLGPMRTPVRRFV
jgi:peptidoglycan/LPS O-acetylase OafA/YrhL